VIVCRPNNTMGDFERWLACKKLLRKPGWCMGPTKVRVQGAGGAISVGDEARCLDERCSMNCSRQATITRVDSRQPRFPANSIFLGDGAMEPIG
jgi:hypothetical protein